MSWYIAVLKNYFGFSGRARRSELWYFILFNFIFAIVLAAIGYAIHFTLLSDIYSLAVLIPSLALAWRRLHDIDKAGGWYFIGLIPIVGWIILLVWGCTEGTQGPNRFGPDPKNPNPPAEGGGYQYV